MLNSGLKIFINIRGFFVGDDVAVVVDGNAAATAAAAAAAAAADAFGFAGDAGLVINVAGVGFENFLDKFGVNWFELFVADIILAAASVTRFTL